MSAVFPNSMYEVSTVTAFATIGSILFTPQLALFLREREGLSRFFLLLGIENVSVVLAGILLLQFPGVPEQADGSPVAFYLAGVLLAIDQCCSGVLENLVVKEWTVVVTTQCEDVEFGNTQRLNSPRLHPIDSGEALACVNARMSQIDLGVGVVIPFAVSELLKHGTDDKVLWLLLFWHAASAVVIGALARELCAVEPMCNTSLSRLKVAEDHLFKSLRCAWSEYRVLPAVARYNMAAYVILCAPLTLLMAAGIN